PWVEAGRPSIRACSGSVRIPAQHVIRIGEGGAISATIVQAIVLHTALPPTFSWLRRSRDGRYAAANFVTSNRDPSRQIAYRIRLSRRAKATTAIRRPRRAARCSAHACSVPLVLLRQHAHAACTKSPRSSFGP